VSWQNSEFTGQGLAALANVKFPLIGTHRRGSSIRIGEDEGRQRRRGAWITRGKQSRGERQWLQLLDSEGEIEGGWSECALCVCAGEACVCVDAVWCVVWCVSGAAVLGRPRSPMAACVHTKRKRGTLSRKLNAILQTRPDKQPRHEGGPDQTVDHPSDPSTWLR
jgi:hypothetical protein